MRLIALVLLCLISAVIPASDILVFIHAKDAGPQVPAGDYIHPLWILWPPASDSTGINRLMSVPSGMNWRSQELDASFETTKTFPNSKNSGSLGDRGYFEATRAYLGETPVIAVSDKSGAYSLDTLQAALTRPLQIPFAAFSGPFPPGLLVTTVDGQHAWDDVAGIVTRVGGRALIVELPGKGDTTWTRAWLKGKGWPDGIPVSSLARIPGLVPATEALDLLREPERHSWIQTDINRWGGPNRWLEFGHYTGPIFLVFVAVFAIYVAGCAVFCIVREESGRLAAILIRLLILGPAILILGGRLAATGQVSKWLSWLVLASAILTMAALGSNLVVKRLLSHPHPLLGEMLVGLVTATLVDPTWSVLGNSIGPHISRVSTEAFGVWCAYGVGSVAFIRSWRFDWKLILMAIPLSSLALATLFLWMPDVTAVLVFATASLSCCLPRGVAMFAVVPAFIGAAQGPLSHGLAYAPQGLYSTYQASQALNVAEHVAFFAKPTFIGFALLAIVVYIAGDRFFSHQIRRTLRFNRQPMALVNGMVVFAVTGIVSPLFLHASLACALGAAATILFDAIRTP